jgi:Rps23 Pro-64 3,4-dihydroxylase Tpa1-like proline 4-hydroxylase
MVIRQMDVPRLRQQFRSASPFPHICIDDFLDRSLAREASQAYPSYSRALKLGQSFSAVNENLKVQVSDQREFPPPVKRLSDALSSPEFLRDLSAITGIERLLWDEQLTGGGMHQTASSGHLDVHVDFNRTPRGLFRRLNILLYLNPVWKAEWGGVLELWDGHVKQCHHALMPVLNRCVIFETSEHSFHGVTAVRCPPSIVRKSFAAYYYTAEPGHAYAGFDHSTRFKARPQERVKRFVLMPAQALRRNAIEGYRGAKRQVKSLLLGARPMRSNRPV